MKTSNHRVPRSGGYAGPSAVEALNGPLHVVILNWNRRDDTVSCLASLEQSTRRPDQTWVVDQGSSDGSVQAIRRRFPEICVVQTGCNTGFARGMNTGIRSALDAGASSVLVLNNDTIVSPTMVERLEASLSPNIGAVGPAIFLADTPHAIWSTGGEISRTLLEMTGHHSRREPLPSRPIERKFVSGCAMLIPRRVFADVGLFDERFFMYYEDLDLCMRMVSAGYKLLIAPDAHLWHRVSQSSGGPNSPAERYQMARSSGLYFRKHMHGWRIPLIVFYRMLSAMRWTARLALQHNPRALCAYWRGLLSGWIGSVPEMPWTYSSSS